MKKTKIDYKAAYEQQRGLYLEVLKEFAVESNEREQAESKARSLEAVLNDVSVRFEAERSNTLALIEDLKFVNRRLYRIPRWIRQIWK